MYWVLRICRLLYHHRLAAAESRYAAYILTLRSCIIGRVQHRRLLFKVTKL
jgi:hypothetical protein